MRNRRQYSLRLFCISLLVALVAAFASSEALADPGGTWTLRSSSGQVQILRTGASPVALTTGDALRPGDLIETGADSHAVLVRGSESIVVSPNSRMGLPKVNDSGFATRILQQAGTLLLKVQKKPQHHFEVKTPYLAAIVKGTTFTVSVDAAGASVHVVEGAVQVGDLGGQIALVRPGQTALVSSSGTGLTVHGGAPLTPATQAAAPAAEDSLLEPAAGPTHEATMEPLPATAGSPSVSITETIGASEIDISVATKGLIRDAGANREAAEDDPGTSVKQAALGVVQSRIGDASATRNAGNTSATATSGGSTLNSLTSPITSSSPLTGGSGSLLGGTVETTTTAAGNLLQPVVQTTSSNLLQPVVQTTTGLLQGTTGLLGLGKGN